MVKTVKKATLRSKILKAILACLLTLILINFGYLTLVIRDTHELVTDQSRNKEVDGILEALRPMVAACLAEPNPGMWVWETRPSQIMGLCVIQQSTIIAPPGK